MYFYAMISYCRKDMFDDVDRRLDKLGVEAEVCENESGHRIYRFSEEQMMKLPRNNKWPYVGSRNDFEYVYMYTDDFIKEHLGWFIDNGREFSEWRKVGA